MTGRVISRYGESMTSAAPGCPAPPTRAWIRRVSASSTLTVTAVSVSGRVPWAYASARSVGRCTLLTSTTAWLRAGQHRALVGRRELGRDVVVVPPDRDHDHVDHDHRGDRDPRAGQELGDHHEHQHEAGHHQADAVDRRGTGTSGGAWPGRARSQQPVPVPQHAGLGQGERHEHADDVELDQVGGLRP